MWISFQFLVLGFAMFMMGAAPVHAQSTRKLLDFEDQAVGTPIFNQYPGVVFPGGDIAGSPVQIVQPSLGTISGTKALRSQRDACEFGCALLAMQFTEGQHRVRMSTGLAQASTSGILAAVLRGYSDVNGTMQVAQSALLILGSMPTTIDNPIEVNSSSGNIRSVVLSIVLPSNPSLPLGNAFPVVIDNLEYDVPVALPPPDITPPIITITRPTAGETVQGALPGIVSINLEATVREEALQSVTIIVNGRPAFAALYFATAPGQYHILVTIYAADGLIAGSNTITITATDFSNNTDTRSTQFTYVDPPLPPPSMVDIVPAGIQISQGIDFGPFSVIRPNHRAGRQFSYPGALNLRLVQEKQVLVRIYAVALHSNAPVPNVPANVFVRQPHCATDCRLPYNGLLVPMLNTTTPNLDGVTVPLAGTPAADPRNRVGDTASSWNFLIPAAWTTQDLDMFVTLNNGNYNSGDNGLANRPSVPECESGIVGECGDNNDLEIHLSFVPAKTVSFNPVFIHPANVEPPDTDASDILRVLNKLYPMHVMLGPTRTFTASQDLDAGDLLDEVQDSFGCGDWWSACGFIPSDFIGGLVPDGYAALAEAGGLSNRGNNTFWAYRRDPPSVAHEMGHAIGFEHAGCAHGEADGGGCDDNYPIPHGGIGGYGFDFDSWSPILPGDTSSSSQQHEHDFMSYGRPQWVSTYTWDITIDDSYTDTVHYRDCSVLGIPIPFTSCGVDHAPSPTADGIALLATSALVVQKMPSMLIAGRINLDGTVVLRPAYPGLASESAVVPSPFTSSYSVAILDAKGNTIALRDVILKRRENGSRDDFTAIVPIPPDRTAARIELIQQGNVIASLTGQPGPAPTVTITSPAGGERWARSATRRISWSTTTRGTVPLRTLVEYSADDGATSIPLRRDVEGNALDVNVDELPASNNARIIVRVSDGVKGAVATSEAFLVDPKPPKVTILEPMNGATLTAGVPMSLIGTASDIQDKTLQEDNLVWTPDVGGMLGIGHQLAVPLSPGPQVITLTATNSLRMSASTSIQVQAETPTPTPTPAPTPTPTPGGGGCTINPGTAFDPVLIGMTVLLLLYLARQYVRNRQRGRVSDRCG